MSYIVYYDPNDGSILSYQGQPNPVATGSVRVGSAESIPPNPTNISELTGFRTSAISSGQPVLTSLPAKYIKVVNDQWVEKSPAEKAAADASEQSAKRGALKRSENKVINFYRVKGIIAPDATTITPANRIAMMEWIDTLPEGQQDAMLDKLNRDMMSIHGLEGSENDIHYHDDV